MLPAGTSSADLEEFIAHTLSREQSLSQALHEEAQVQLEADALETAQAMFVAYYARTADPAGLNYWSDQLVVTQGDTSAISQGFGDSEEFLAAYGGLDEVELITKLYQQLFARDPDQGGLDFNANQLQTGAMAPADIAMAIAQGARGSDADLWQAKLAAADAVTRQLAQHDLMLKVYRGDLERSRGSLPTSNPARRSGIRRWKPWAMT
ncbi:hypothetical protein HALO32_01347 [Halomonas lysinitropha]|uniref:DUF4214 domain-containing protein n=2 Tax=Halomonas lysinitropha TaxID=2607506 RepID=A0A5K1I8D2_9GAMM|nr:hypothetical protein HALO32_01347 [Halomonas lysinitropha]